MTVRAETQIDLARVDDGQSGANGVSVTAVKPQYYLSTSDSSATGGSWSDTPQAFVSGKYYWTRDYVTYSDGNHTTSTAVYNRGMTQASQDALDAHSIATSTNNYFWHNSVDSGAGEGTGAHITEVDQDTFISNLAGANTLVDSQGLKVRDGVDVLAQFNGTFAQLGKANGSKLIIRPNGLNIYTEDNVNAFSVAATNNTQEVSVFRIITAWNNIGYQESGTFTINDSIISGSDIMVEVVVSDTYVCDAFFTEGVSGTQTEDNITITYDGASTIGCTNNNHGFVNYANVEYSMLAPQSEVNVTGELNIIGIPFASILTQPELVTTGLVPYKDAQNVIRCDIVDGGYIDIGQWRYVNMTIMLNKQMSVSDYHTEVTGFAIPATGLASLACSIEENKDVISGYISDTGRLILSSNTVRPVGDVITVTGLYIMT